MISENKTKLTDKKIKGKIGGIANESRFFTTERELRKHKIVVVPSVNTNSMVKLEQGWNKKARENDVVRIIIGDLKIITTREELEQGIAALAQGAETIKYTAPTIGNGEDFINKFK